jgi:hypothetical protein
MAIDLVRQDTSTGRFLSGGDFFSRKLDKT